MRLLLPAHAGMIRCDRRQPLESGGGGGDGTAGVPLPRYDAPTASRSRLLAKM